jgi:TctA family transporter
MPKQEDQRTGQEEIEQGRRDFLKGSVAAAGAGVAAAAVPGVATAQATHEPSNPYGPRPGGGISLPD